MSTTTIAHAIDANALKRSELLRQLGLMDTPPEEEFDELVELASTLCSKPMAAMTLLDEQTQLIKARFGLQGSRVTSIRDSICQYTVRENRVLIIEDARKDRRFDDLEAVQAEGGVRFYAGTPITSMNGTNLGALCVMDTEPSTLTDAQQRALEILGRQLSNQVQLRERALHMAKLMEERDRGRELFNTILNNVPVEIYLKDEGGHIRFYNQKLAERFGINREEWIGKTSFDLWERAAAEEITREEDIVMRSGKAHESFLILPEPNGNTSYWRSFKSPCTSMDGENVLACCSIDVTSQMKREEELQQMQDELEEANRKLNSLALTDALTGLWNRRAFDARLETTVISSQRSKQPMALLLIDADNFKSINDRFGHPYGDTVLKNIATVMNRVKRAEDVACRYGGEEFAILLPGSDTAGAHNLAERILDGLRMFPWEKELVTASIGLAMCSDTCSADDLIDDADTALYKAKHEGKNRVVHHGCTR